ILIYLLLSVSTHLHIRDYIKIFFAGIFAGLIINFHISFGIGVLAGIIIFFIIEFIWVSFTAKMICYKTPSSSPFTGGEFTSTFQEKRKQKLKRKESLSHIFAQRI